MKEPGRKGSSRARDEFVLLGFFLPSSPFLPLAPGAAVSPPVPRLHPEPSLWQPADKESSEAARSSRGWGQLCQAGQRTWERKEERWA